MKIGTNVHYGGSVLIVLITTISVTRGTSNDSLAFEAFLMHQFSNYSVWLQMNMLDPTPVIPDEVEVSDDFSAPLTNVSGKIWNQRIFNHSNIYGWEVFADLENFDLTVHIDMLELTISGEYQVSGVYNNTSISGSGMCESVAHHTSFGGPDLGVKFEKFRITPEGHVDLEDATVTQDFSAEHYGTFEYLAAGGYEDKVVEVLLSEQFRHITNWIPLAEYLEDFLQEIFDHNSLEDMIGPH